MAGGVSLRRCPIQTSQGDRGDLREATPGSSGAGACPFKCAGRALCAFRGPSPGWWARGGGGAARMSERARGMRVSAGRGERAAGWCTAHERARQGSAHKRVHGRGARGGGVNARWAGPGLLARSARADQLSRGARAPGGGPGGHLQPLGRELLPGECGLFDRGQGESGRVSPGSRSPLLARR